MIEVKIIASGSKGNCYLIDDGATQLLIEAGIPIFDIRVGVNFALQNISAALISHAHGDHSKAILDIIKRGIDVYAPEDVITKFGLAAHHRAHVPEAIKPFRIGTYTIMAFDCVHDAPTFGYLIRSNKTGEQLLYYTDTHYIQYKFPGIDYLMGECNFDAEILNANVENDRIPMALRNRILSTHMSIQQFIKLIYDNGYEAKNGIAELKKVFLLHLSDANIDAEKIKTIVQQVTACEVIVA